MIKKLIITDLWDIKGKNYNIDFDEKINLLTGSNGSGKTTILKIMWCLISGHFDILTREVNFGKIELFTDKNTISISKKKQKGLDFFNLEIKGKGAQTINNYKINPVADSVHNSLFFPTFRRIEGGFSIVPKMGELVEHNEIYVDFNELSQRLSRFGYSNNNHEFIAYVSTNDLDRRLNEKKAELVDTEKPINEAYNQKLVELIDANQNEEAVKLIKTHQQNQQKRQQRFSVLNNAVQFFFKKGVKLTDNLTIGKTEDKKNALNSQNLSSGEKQMLAFLCYNIFAENACIFIDEPELSLHPDWQRQLLPTLLDQGTDNQFFITTHSPFIYTKFADKDISLNDDKGE